jgi:large subunit ribosomal protein L14e
LSAIEVGRLCKKLTGREKGRRCVVVDIIDRNYVLVTGPVELTGVRRRRTNMSHIEPIDDKIDIKKGASDEEIKELLG